MKTQSAKVPLVFCTSVAKGCPIQAPDHSRSSGSASALSRRAAAFPELPLPYPLTRLTRSLEPGVASGAPSTLVNVVL